MMIIDDELEFSISLRFLQLELMTELTIFFLYSYLVMKFSYLISLYLLKKLHVDDNLIKVLEFVWNDLLNFHII